MGKPYSDLEKRAIAILAGGGNPATSQDQAVARYWAWKINPSASSHRLPTTSKRPNNRKKDAVHIKIFAEVLPTNVFAKVQVSKRTMTALGNNIKAACNYETLSSSDMGLKLKGFSPAYVYWRTGEATTSAERTSRITNRSYKSYYTATDEGYLAPFGRLNAETEGVRQKAIRTAIGSGVNLITFTPEKYRG